MRSLGSSTKLILINLFLVTFNSSYITLNYNAPFTIDYCLIKMFLSFIQLMAVMLTQISPQALNLLIGFTSSEEEIWKGYLYMILLVGINLVNTILNSQFYIKQMLIGLRVRAAITSALFRKSLRLSSKSRKERCKLMLKDWWILLKI